MKLLELQELGVNGISQFRREVTLDSEKCLVKFTYIHSKHDCTTVVFSWTSGKEKSLSKVKKSITAISREIEEV